MGRYAVDPARLHDVDQDIGSTVAHARAAPGSLGAEMHTLLDAGWRSPAAFATCWHEWRAGASELLLALEEMGRAVGTSAQGYALTEQSVQSSLAAS